MALYADDLLIRYFARNDFEVESFSTRALLEILHRRGLLPNEEYHDALLELLRRNYSIITISMDTLIRSVERSSYTASPDSLLPFEELRRETIDHHKLVKITEGFLRWLWRHANHPFIRSRWTDVILNAVGYRRPRLALPLTNHLLKNRARILPSLAPDQLFEEFALVIRGWRAGQIIL